MSRAGWTRAGWAMMLAITIAGSAVAGTLQEDEARIEALLSAERTAASASGGEAASATIPQLPDGGSASVPVIAKVVAPLALPSANDEWLAPPVHADGMAFADLAQNVGHRVSITTAGEREHRGLVKAANARQVTLQVRRAGGNATYTLRRDQIVRIDPR